MSFCLVQPESFDPGEFLKSPALKNRFDDARYFISLVLTKFARRDVDERGLVRLMAKHLASIMDCRSYSDIIEALRNGKAIERFPYSPGARSFGFRLGERFIMDRHIRVPATDPRLLRRLEKFHLRDAEDRQARMKPVHRRLADQQTRLEIHGDNARTVLKGLPSSSNPFDVQGLQISDIENREFHTNVGRYGRLTNNITSLKRELRRTLHVEGELLSSVDLSCAQPALIAKLVIQGIRRQIRGEEQSRGKYDYQVSQYVSLVQSGELYEFLVDKLRQYGIDRDEVKRRVLVDVIAKKGRYFSIVEDQFRDSFPMVYQYIREVNADDHANLIRLLQREESQFVIETVAADFLSRHPQAFVISLHDALYTTSRHLPALQQSFHRGFEQIGFPMHLKVEA